MNNLIQLYAMIDQLKNYIINVIQCAMKTYILDYGQIFFILSLFDDYNGIFQEKKKNQKANNKNERIEKECKN